MSNIQSINTVPEGNKFILVGGTHTPYYMNNFLENPEIII
jgi:hypothetical protein